MNKREKLDQKLQEGWGMLSDQDKGLMVLMKDFLTRPNPPADWYEKAGQTLMNSIQNRLSAQALDAVIDDLYQSEDEEGA